ncbi:MAG: phosphoribosylanthranilate isomerase [Gammaproteobacteria bacterium]|nr:phosphoribosylanthranilate isomerase [Gammaproteobacteria bacterium]MCW9031192.1 phosphoribosylanthranilate isomerase [Gammaproteobacteria bacterium]
MLRTRIKICGINHREDALKAAEFGADAIGLVFVEKSPRYVSFTEARVIADAMPPFVTLVGLFMDAPAEFVREALKAVPLSLLQFHGDESAEYCDQFNVPYIKALRMGENVNVIAYAQEYPGASGILLDAYHEGVGGGTGITFDWDLIPGDVPFPLILAGGLNVENVAKAIEKVKPYAVDVSSGVESRPAVKDHQKIEQFIKEVQRVG